MLIVFLPNTDSMILHRSSDMWTSDHFSWEGGEDSVKCMNWKKIPLTS
jgi:hypothetical protein